MKKGLLIWLTLILWGVLSGCDFFQIVDWDWMEREIQYPVAEQECIDNDGQLSTDDDGNQICILSDDEFCYLEDIENWKCEWLHEWGGERITVVTDMCEEQWWEVQYWQEGGDDFEICWFDDESFCYLEDLAAWACEKGDMKYEDWWDDELAECDAQGEKIVCWKDGNTYFNACYLDFAGVEEETESAEVVDWKCVFG